MLPLIAVGFVMMTVGVALLCLGEVPIARGKRVPALRSRLIGLIFVSFLPLALGVRQATVALFEPDAVEGLVVSWSICGVCWFATLAILFRVLVPKRDRAKAKAAAAGTASKNPFGEAGLETTPVELPFIDAIPTDSAPQTAAKKPGPAAVKKTPAKKPSKPASQENNPFDFS